MFCGKVLSDSDIQRINKATLDILKKVGLKIEHEGFRKSLLAAGAQPGRDNETLRFPPEMVKEYLALAPDRVKLCGTGDKEWTVGPGAPPVFWTAAAMNLVGPGGRTEFDRRELARLSRLVDALPNIDGIVGVSIRDVTPEFRD
ncbi:MAG: trimethylamine methyltransferase family protein, partial [Gemmatimonadota bacterium]|nr:trimethylamine methyltransferase family protein [Gemmatimonadota bacterium]